MQSTRWSQTTAVAGISLAVLCMQPIRVPLQKNLFFGVEIIGLFPFHNDAIRR
jgi:hypothetical protein